MCDCPTAEEGPKFRLNKKLCTSEKASARPATEKINTPEANSVSLKHGCMMLFFIIQMYLFILIPCMYMHVFSIHIGKIFFKRPTQAGPTKPIHFRRWFLSLFTSRLFSKKMFFRRISGYKYSYQPEIWLSLE